jgi:hypothetical protein
MSEPLYRPLLYYCDRCKFADEYTRLREEYKDRFDDFISNHPYQPCMDCKYRSGKKPTNFELKEGYELTLEEILGLA